ncbi:hypothetical protein ATY78_13500 [Rhizobium sp. R635]|nr:hypothetical protein ATY78_13500 [Rhizobium sp. R635]
MSRYLLAIAALLVLIPAFAHASEARGKASRLATENCSEIGSMIVAQVPAGPTYGATHLKCGPQQVLRLERQTGRDGVNPIWTPVDQIAVTMPTPRHEILGPGYCSSSQFPDDATIIALGTMAEQPDGSYGSENVVKAWRFDIKREKMVAIPVSGVLCAVDGGD